jgi:hypothetical protein
MQCNFVKIECQKLGAIFQNFKNHLLVIIFPRVTVLFFVCNDIILGFMLTGRYNKNGYFNVLIKFRDSSRLKRCRSVFLATTILIGEKSVIWMKSHVITNKERPIPTIPTKFLVKQPRWHSPTHKVLQKNYNRFWIYQTHCVPDL